VNPPKDFDTKDEYSHEETARRRDAVLKILVNTPPQPQATRSNRPGKKKTTVSGPADRKPSARQKKPE
jgi:hypothetical protein